MKWCQLFLHTDKATPHHSTRLNEVFGQPTSQLSTYLRSNLLIQQGLYKVGSKSFSYLLNQRGYDKVAANIDADTMFVTSVPLNSKHVDELESLTFEYSEKSNRYWHPLQNMHREEKAAFWREKGLPFDYDIEACAPTILFSLAKRLGMHDIVAEPILEYLNDKASMREHVAQLVGISLNDSKRLINSLFNGARLSATPFCSAFLVVGQSKEKMELLRSDRRVRLLRSAIKLTWRKLQWHTDEDLSNGRGKWGLYFRMEQHVLDCIKQHLTSTGNRHFTEHDGFRTEREVDLVLLSGLVHEQTGFKLKIHETSE